VAASDWKVRIEVGYGLEPVLPDGLAGSIIRSDFLPKFRNGAYADGIQDGVRHIGDIVRQNHVLTAEERRQLDPGDTGTAWVPTIFFGLFVFVGGFIAGAGLGAKVGFPLIFGALFGGLPFAMALVPAFNVSRITLGLLAVAAGVLGFRRARTAPWIREMRETGRRHGRRGDSGWVMGTSGSGSGSSSSSSSSSGGGFGGGSSGGGGASGSW